MTRPKRSAKAAPPRFTGSWEDDPLLELQAGLFRSEQAPASELRADRRGVGRQDGLGDQGGEPPPPHIHARRWDRRSEPDRTGGTEDRVTGQMSWTRIGQVQHSDWMDTPFFRRGVLSSGVVPAANQRPERIGSSRSQTCCYPAALHARLGLRRAPEQNFVRLKGRQIVGKTSREIGVPELAHPTEVIRTLVIGCGEVEPLESPAKRSVIRGPKAHVLVQLNDAVVYLDFPGNVISLLARCYAPAAPAPPIAGRQNGCAGNVASPSSGWTGNGFTRCRCERGRRRGHQGSAIAARRQQHSPPYYQCKCRTSGHTSSSDLAGEPPTEATGSILQPRPTGRQVFAWRHASIKAWPWIPANGFGNLIDNHGIYLRITPKILRIKLLIAGVGSRGGHRPGFVRATPALLATALLFRDRLNLGMRTTVERTPELRR